MAKLNKAQSAFLEVFYGEVGWGIDDETELTKLNESLEKAKQAVKTLEEQISGFGTRKEKAAELLQWFDAGPMGATASDDDKITFLCQSLKVRKKSVSSGSSTNTAKASDEEKEALLDHLDGEGKTVGQLAASCGLESKEVSRIAKAMLADGTARKEGERRGTRYFLNVENVDDSDDTSDEE